MAKPWTKCQGISYRGAQPVPCRRWAVRNGLCGRHLYGQRRTREAEVRRKLAQLPV